jgi:NDP-sugar pyrophosphorylase family protein
MAKDEQSPVPRACVLAGGLGLRLRPAVGDLPKVLAPVGGRPFLDYILRQLAFNGVRRATVCTGYGADRVEAFLAEHAPRDMEVGSSRERRPLGTAGAVRQAWAGLEDDTMVVLNGDSFFDVPIAQLIAAHRAAGASATLAVRRTDEAGRYGTVEVSSDGWVTAFREKAEAGPGLMNGGVYVVDRHALEGLAAGKPASLEKDVFPGLTTGRRPPEGQSGGLLAVEFAGFFVDVGIPADYTRIDADPSAIRHALGAA